MTTTRLSPSADAFGRSEPTPATDFAAVTVAWSLAVLAAAFVPLQSPPVTRAALFIHVMTMAVGFGAVVMTDVYGLLWLAGRRTVAELTDLARAAHGVILFGTGGLLASGIVLRPDLQSGLARLKLGLVLVCMLNGAAAQRMLRRLKADLPTGVRGPSIPWAVFQRVILAALVSQATWWGAIVIGFVTNAGRHG